MRVLQVITLSEVGGAQVVCLNLAQGLARHGFKVDLACQPGGWLENRAREVGLDVFPLPHMRRSISPLKDAQTLHQLVSLVRRNGYDIVHCHSTKAGILGRLASAICGVPSVFTVHGWAFSEGVNSKRRRLALLLERLMGHFPAWLVCVSYYDYHLVLRFGVPCAGHLSVIWNGIEDIPARFLARPEEGSPINIIMVARFSAQKNHEELLHAVYKLRGEFKLTLVGDGPLLTHCKAQMEQLRLSSRVEFLGERQDVPEILARSHIAVLCSHWEGLPISILEAMRAGLPVVATHVGGVPELVQHGTNGFLVPGGDIVALVASLQTLIDSPLLRQQMGRAGRIRMLQDFSLDRMIKQYIDLYGKVIEGKLQPQKGCTGLAPVEGRGESVPPSPARGRGLG